jgi:NADH:ubiquinone oxidoreductase subunit E
MSKVPTRSPTHEDIELSRLASMGLEVEDIADGDEVTIPALVELAEDRGRPVSHYLAAVPLATELRVRGGAPLTLKVCAGTCQRYGALDLLDALAERWMKDKGARFSIAPVSCLDRCDQAPACEVHGDHGQLVIAPATLTAIDEALGSL